MMCDQSRSRCQPKNGLRQPCGIMGSSIAGETWRMTSTPTAMLAMVNNVNCRSSVDTTLNMPPLTTYSVVIAMTRQPHSLTLVLGSGDNGQGRKVEANLPIPMYA